MRGIRRRAPDRAAASCRPIAPARQRGAVHATHDRVPLACHPPVRRDGDGRRCRGARRSRRRVRPEPVRRLHHRRPRHQLRERRSRAVAIGQPCKPDEHDRRVAAGPLVERRRPRARRRLHVRRRRDLGTHAAAVQRMRAGRAQVRARVRSVGLVRAGRHRVLGVDLVQPVEQQQCGAAS
ncbi:hypothetical protein EDI_314450, partial [Entamoeba dispar SAW760]